MEGYIRQRNNEERMGKKQEKSDVTLIVCAASLVAALNQSRSLQAKAQSLIYVVDMTANLEHVANRLRPQRKRSM